MYTTYMRARRRTFFFFSSLSSSLSLCWFRTLRCVMCTEKPAYQSVWAERESIVFFFCSFRVGQPRGELVLNQIGCRLHGMCYWCIDWTCIEITACLVVVFCYSMLFFFRFHSNWRFTMRFAYFFFPSVHLVSCGDNTLINFTSNMMIWLHKNYRIRTHLYVHWFKCARNCGFHIIFIYIFFSFYSSLLLLF